MTGRRQDDVAYEAACRIISPKEVRVMVSLICALLLAVLYLWNESRTQWSWIVSMRGEVAELKAGNRVAGTLEEQSEQMKKQSTVLRAIAESMGVQLDEEE